MNWKEILISSAEVAFLGALVEISALQQISWATLVPVAVTFGIKLLQGINVRMKGTSSKKKVPKIKTLFFKY